MRYCRDNRARANGHVYVLRALKQCSFLSCGNSGVILWRVQTGYFWGRRHTGLQALRLIPNTAVQAGLCIQADMALGVLGEMKTACGNLMVSGRHLAPKTKEQEDLG